jgi:hypothetical protein
MRRHVICRERCGWRGWIATGWRVVTAEAARTLPARRLRRRADGAILYRARLRDSTCPGCGKRGVEALVYEGAMTARAAADASRLG